MKNIYPKNTGKPVGPYSPAIDTGNLIFFSGQIGITSSGTLKNNSFESEVIQIFKNIDALLEASFCTKRNIAKVTIFLTDIKNYQKFNVLYEKYLDGILPSRSCIEVSNLPLNMKVEVECIVSK
jgi:2-iminobutanoate/2-iminopropanoate deaminase